MSTGQSIWLQQKFLGTNLQYPYCFKLTPWSKHEIWISTPFFWKCTLLSIHEGSFTAEEDKSQVKNEQNDHHKPFCDTMWAIQACIYGYGATTLQISFLQLFIFIYIYCHFPFNIGICIFTPGFLCFSHVNTDKLNARNVLWAMSASFTPHTAQHSIHKRLSRVHRNDSVIAIMSSI